MDVRWAADETKEMAKWFPVADVNKLNSLEKQLKSNEAFLNRVVGTRTYALLYNFIRKYFFFALLQFRFLQKLRPHNEVTFQTSFRALVTESFQLSLNWTMYSNKIPMTDYMFFSKLIPGGAIAMRL